LLDSSLPPASPPASPAALLRLLKRLPIFPLPGVVLFPNALLPLHIFEERYRKMARDTLMSGRHLAVACLKSSEEALVSERPEVRRVMGVGEIVLAHELPDGRFNVVLRGWTRVYIDQELATDEPYRIVSASLRRDLPVADPGELRDADQVLRALVNRLADDVAEGGELLRQIVWSQSEPADLADVLAAALVAEPKKRQRLLEMRNVVKRIETVSACVASMLDPDTGGVGRN
jgi:uncharacterized protein